MNRSDIYCPVCGRWLSATNAWDVLNGIADGYVFIHDEIPHSNEEMEALERGVQ